MRSRQKGLLTYVIQSTRDFDLSKVLYYSIHNQTESSLNYVIKEENHPVIRTEYWIFSETLRFRFTEIQKRISRYKLYVIISSFMKLYFICKPLNICTFDTYFYVRIVSNLTILLLLNFPNLLIFTQTVSVLEQVVNSCYIRIFLGEFFVYQISIFVQSYRQVR